MSGLYTYAWQKARAFFLRQHPLCCICKLMGRIVPATEVDHIVPHHGDYELFWDQPNWQPLCKRHHSQKTAAERAGRAWKIKGCRVDGSPIDPSHPWNQ